MLLFASNCTLKQVAAVIGCDVKTFRKVFPLEAAARLKAELIVRSGMMSRLADEGERGNVGALKALDKMIQAEQLRATGQRIKDRAKAPKPAPLGKKEAAIDAAKGLGGRFGTRPAPPGLLIN